MKTASVSVKDARISLKHSKILCKRLRGKRIDKARSILENLINRKISINNKYYSNAAKKFVEILNNVEANARFKGLDTEKLFIKIIKADKGSKFIRPKSRFRFRGREAKSTNLTVVVEEK